MSVRSQVIKYVVIRLLAFIVPLAIVVIVNPSWWIAGVVMAAIISLAVSYIFLEPQRRAVSEAIGRRRAKPSGVDDADAEDALVDRQP